MSTSLFKVILRDGTVMHCEKGLLNSNPMIHLLIWDALPVSLITQVLYIKFWLLDLLWWGYRTEQEHP